MQRSKLFKILSVGTIAVSTAISPLAMPASAQVTQPEVETPIVEEDNDFDWGWLGLLGLIGLAGLAGKKRHDHTNTTTYRDPNVTRTGYRE